jgi:hypothetical protein
MCVAYHLITKDNMPSCCCCSPVEKPLVRLMELTTEVPSLVLLIIHINQLSLSAYCTYCRYYSTTVKERLCASVTCF